MNAHEDILFYNLSWIYTHTHTCMYTSSFSMESLTGLHEMLDTEGYTIFRFTLKD